MNNCVAEQLTYCGSECEQSNESSGTSVKTESKMTSNPDFEEKTNDCVADCQQERSNLPGGVPLGILDGGVPSGGLQIMT